MRWEVIFQPQNLALYAEGLTTTLWLLVTSLLAGGVLAVLCALLLTSTSRALMPLRWLTSTYTYCLRGTPLLIQVYLIYYGLAQLEFVQSRWDAVWPWTYFKEALFCAWLAFALNTAAYTAEMLAGAMRETSAGEIEAAQAMGMSQAQVLARVVLPSAMRRTLPAYSNEVVMMLHSTSLASAVPAILDITSAASRIYARFFLPFEAYMFAAVIYLSITFLLVLGFRWAEKRFLGFLAPQRG